ncbi:hypothetical protein ACFYSC_20785 [Streptosporangium sp. NPDC004379]|uniref:hypothetical protein n=1 Tax=Streptosporangium sp. NPDC004379 TaxID=3366189 RepID=UPI0036A43B6F
MEGQHRVAAHHGFIDQLKELREQAGGPTLSQIKRLSIANAKREKYAALEPSTTHDILSGKRKRLPPWPWVDMFVAACHAAAVENGLPVEPLGGRADWNARWRAARVAREDAEDPLSDAARPPARPPDSRTGEATPASPVTVQTKPPEPDVADAVALWRERQGDREVYGRIGARLLGEIEMGDPQDCMRMAVIAWLRNQHSSAYLWLHRAGDAARLLRPSSLTEAAAELAFRYGRHYERAARIGVAMFFYRLADRHGHPAAAFHSDLIEQRRRHEHAAAPWSDSAGPNGYFRTAVEITSGWARIGDPLWKENDVVPAEAIEPIIVVESPQPTEDPPLAVF